VVLGLKKKIILKNKPTHILVSRVYVFFKPNLLPSYLNTKYNCFFPLLPEISLKYLLLINNKKKNKTQVNKPTMKMCKRAIGR
jgi:hypothetical protein